MYCVHCGAELPPQSNFCSTCGTSGGSINPPQWETCEIHYLKVSDQQVVVEGVFALSSHPEILFWVQVRGARGESLSNPSRSRRVQAPFGWPVETDQLHQTVLGEFIQQLHQEGWALSGKGDNWWSFQYRRLCS